MRDALDIIMPRARFTAKATYYKELPESPDVGGMRFHYEYIDPATREYRRLFGNFQSFEAGEIAIRTNARLPFRTNGLVILATGETYTVTNVQKDFSRAPKQAMRIVGIPIGVEYVLRMTTTRNPWGDK